MPIGTAISVVDNRQQSGCSAGPRAERVVDDEASIATEPVRPQQYQSVVNPAQALRERESLNENWIEMRTGTRLHSMYSQVMATGSRAAATGCATAGRSAVLSSPSASAAPAASMPTVGHRASFDARMVKNR